jgi:hypothetical protein
VFSVFWGVTSTIMQSWHLIWFFMALALVPGVVAQSEESPFPNTSFKLFTHFIKENFSSQITLSQVLLVLFTLTNSPDFVEPAC